MNSPQSLDMTTTKSKVETVKEASHGLRGNLLEELASDAPSLTEESFQLLKFHGSYQQDDRDERRDRRKAGLDKAWQFMIRSKIPGGDLSRSQYLAHDNLATDLANGTLRLTNRQDIQLHGVLKASLRTCLQKLHDSGLTTWGACGDIVRNTTATAIPIMSQAHLAAQELAQEISRTFYAQSPAYSRIWLDGEEVTTTPDAPLEPFYGEAYLPRKFKIGIAVPPNNDVDVLSNDVALIAVLQGEEIVGYNVHVGGSFGMSHGQTQTEPALAKPLLYVPKGEVLEMLGTIIGVQRDFGRRDDRKQARLKYLLRDRGIEWFRMEVANRRIQPLEPVRPAQLGSVADTLGWHEQGDGRFFVGIWVPDGRVADSPHRQYRKAFREICERFDLSLRISPNANFYLYNVAPEDHLPIDSILNTHGISTGTELTLARQMSHACVAHPTCGLALAESERVFQSVMDGIDDTLTELGLRNEPLLVRISGCPNGCSRPYNADFALVGRAPNKYALYVGGSYRGDHLAGLEHKSLELGSIQEFVREALFRFVRERLPSEAFGEFWRRVHNISAIPTAEQFHLERAERDPQSVHR